MQELINRLQNTHGLSAEQSHGVLNTIKDYIKEKFPMVEGAIDSLFPHHESGDTTPAGDTGSTEGSAAKGGSFLDEQLP